MPQNEVAPVDVVDPDDEDEIGVGQAEAEGSNAGLSLQQRAAIDDAKRLVTDEICRRINTKLGGEHIFGDPLRDVLYRAWSLAAILRNFKVSVEHVIAALATSDEAIGNNLETILGDRIVPLAATMSRLAGQQGFGAQDAKALLPQQSLADWLTEAAQHSRRRNAAEIDLMSDFIGVLDDTGADPGRRYAILTAFARAREAGHGEAQLDRLRREYDTMRQTTSRLRSEVLHALTGTVAEISKSTTKSTAELRSTSATVADAHRAALDEAVGTLQAAVDRTTSDIRSGVDSLGEALHASLSTGTDDMKSAIAELARKQADADGSLRNSLATTVTALADHRAGVTGEVERLRADLKAATPPALSRAAVVGGILAALTIGSAIGIALHHLPKALLP